MMPDAARGNPVRRPGAGPGLIDVHQHAPAEQESVQHRLDVLDRLGIGTAVLAAPQPGQRSAREINESLAELVRRHPSRFGAFAVLPLPDVPATLAELHHALDVLGVDGVTLLTSYGRYLGDPAFDPVLAELALRAVPVQVHPLGRSGGSVSESADETTRTVASLLCNGSLARHPGLKLILSHAGGTVPYLATRLASSSHVDALDSLRRLYYDVAMSANRFALPSLSALVDPTHILFGSDFPLVSEECAAENIAELREYEGFTGCDRMLIAARNALDLFPRLTRLAHQETGAGRTGPFLS